MELRVLKGLELGNGYVFAIYAQNEVGVSQEGAQITESVQVGFSTVGDPYSIFFCNSLSPTLEHRPI